MKFGMGIGLKNARNYNADYAMEFNGTDEYMQIALPSELVTNGNFETGTNSFWSEYSVATYNDTEIGKTGNYCCKSVSTGAQGLRKFSLLTIGKKYKLSLRYKGTVGLRIGNDIGTSSYGILSATSEWNTVTKIFTATSAALFLVNDATGTVWIDDISIKEDQGFDLNKDQEQILHSKNADFERTLGAEISSGTVTIGKKYIVTAGTVEGNAVGTEFLAVTNATTLDASNKVKEIPNLVSNGTCEGTYVSGRAPNWTGSGSEGTSSEQTGVSGKAQGFTYTSDIATWNIRAVLNSSYVSGKRYRITFNYTRVSGTSTEFSIRFGTTIYSVTGADGTWKTYTVDSTASSSLDYLAFGMKAGHIDAVWAVDNIHIYEIPEWTPSGNHTADISILDKVGTGATNTQSYKVTASGAGRSAELLANGTFTDGTGWVIEAGTPTWTISGGTLNGNGVSGAKAAYNTTLAGLSSGDTVEVTGTITNRTVGYFNIKVGYGVGGTVQAISANGTFIARVVVGASGTNTLYFDGFGFDGSVDNVSVKKYFGEITLPSTNLESCVATKKYTLEGFARLDPASLTYANSYTSDFSVDVNGWSGVLGCTTTGNNDGIGGKDNCLAIISDNSNGNHRVIGVSTDSSKVAKIIFEYYIPSTNVKFNGFYIEANSINASGFHTTKDAWTTIPAVYYKASAIIRCVDSSNGLVYVGNTGDVIYIRAITIDLGTPPTLTAQLGTKSVTSSALSIVSGTFTKFVLNFEATSGEVNQDLKLWLSGAGSVYVDKLSLTQAYDMWVGGKAKISSTPFTMLFSQNTDFYFGCGNLTGVYPNEAIGTIFSGVGRYSSGTSSSEYLDNVWRSFSTKIDRTNEIQMYVNGTERTYLNSSNISTTLGKYIATIALYIMRYISTNFAGQISRLQIIRFENISQSSFNSAITGLQYPVGGGAEEVLRLTFQDGTSFANCVKDYSPKNHSISNPGTTMNLTNRKRVV